MAGIRVAVGDRVWEEVHVADAAVIREVAIVLVLGGEKAHREAAVSGHEWRVKQRAAALERRRKEAEEAARRERERIAALERRRVERLLGEAAAWQNARAIRAYVAEVRAASPPVAAADLQAWADWALARADMIDPVVSLSFLRSPEEG